LCDFKEHILIRMFILYFAVFLFTRFLRQSAPTGVNKMFCLARVAVCVREPSCAHGVSCLALRGLC